MRKNDRESIRIITERLEDLRDMERKMAHGQAQLEEMAQARARVAQLNETQKGL